MFICTTYLHHTVQCSVWSITLIIEALVKAFLLLDDDDIVEKQMKAQFFFIVVAIIDEHEHIYQGKAT